MRPCVVIQNRLSKSKPCINNGMCETCRVPPALGFAWDGKRWQQTYQVESWQQAAERICREALEEERQR